MESMSGIVLAVCISERQGEKKRDVTKALLVAEHGLEGDAHAGDGHRQVSILADESVDTMRGRGIELNHGDFAENLTVRGLDLKRMSIGQRLGVGSSAVLEVTQIGKECHNDCAIRQQVGDCVMPREGVFARVVAGGEVKTGDSISIVE